jgi:hypothetical protein
MLFYVTVGNGTDGRYADTIQFVDGNGVTYTVAVAPATLAHRTSSVSLVGTNGEQLELSDVDDVGRQIARLLVLCRDQSLVVGTSRGTRLRGNEETTADVYPPRCHPRIVVKG